MKLAEVAISKSKNDSDNMKAFMAEIVERSHAHISDHMRAVAFKSSDQIVSFEVEPGFGENVAYLTSVIATPPRHGTGSLFMKWLCEIADRHHVALKLMAQPFGRNAMPETLLKKWYGRFGFKRIGPGGMFRAAL